jgi:hypothetical protein
MKTTIFFLFICMMTDFLIIRRDDCARYGINGENVLDTYVLDFNRATVGELRDGRFVVIPLVGEFCMATYNKELLQLWIQNRKFPVGLETKDPFERCTYLIDNLEDAFQNSNCEVARIFGIPESEICNVDYDVLDSAINKTKMNLQVEELDKAFVALNLYLLMRFRNIRDVPIKLKKIETLNTYLVPVLDFSESAGILKEYSFRKDLSEGLTKGKLLKTEALIKFALMDFYNLNPLGSEAQNLFKKKLQ